MKRKPTNYNDMLKTVHSVRHPKIKLQHRIILDGIAQFADAATGRLARPTHAYLGQGTGWTMQYVGKLIRELEKMGLIQCLSRATGPGVAAHYRICLENPAYPDTYPTCKANGETPEGNGETPGVEHPNSQPETVKLLEGNGETPVFHLSEAASKAESTPPSPETPRPATERVVVAKMPEGWVTSSQTLATMGEPTNADVRRLEALAKPYGPHAWELLHHIIGNWQDTRPKGMKGLNEPWRFFFREYPAARIRAFVKDHIDWGLRVGDPETVQNFKAAEANFRRMHHEKFSGARRMDSGLAPGVTQEEAEAFMAEEFGEPVPSTGGDEGDPQ